MSKIKQEKVNARRARQILDAAIVVAETVGYMKITHDEISEEAGVSRSLIQYYFFDMSTLRSAVVEYAISIENITVLAQALGCLDPIALRAPVALRAKALARVEEIAANPEKNGIRANQMPATIYRAAVAFSEGGKC